MPVIPTMADPTTAGGGTEGLRDELLKRMSCASGSEEEGGDCTCRTAASSQAWQEHDRLCAYRLIREAEAALARASAEQARVEAENARLRAQNADLRAQVEAMPHADRVKAFYDRMFARHESRPRVASPTAEQDGLKAALVALSRVVDEGHLKADAPAQAAFDLALKLPEAPDAP